MTANELTRYIGRAFFYHVNGMTFHVRVVDARMRFGQVDVCVAPIGGSGSAWIQFGSLGSEVPAE